MMSLPFIIFSRIGRLGILNPFHSATGINTSAPIAGKDEPFVCVLSQIRHT